MDITAGDVDDATLALFKLLISLVEHATDLLVSTVSSPRSILILKQLLSLSSLPGYFGVDEDISNIGLDVWEMLQEGIIDSVGEDGEDPIPGKTDAKQIWAIAKDVFGALVPALRRKVQWPPEDTLRTWPKGEIRIRFNEAPKAMSNDDIPRPDVKEKFRVYRSRVAEALLQAWACLRCRTKPFPHLTVSRCAGTLYFVKRCSGPSWKWRSRNLAHRATVGADGRYEA